MAAPSVIATLCLLITANWMLLCNAAPLDTHSQSTGLDEQSEDLRTAVETFNFIRSQMLADSDQDEAEEVVEDERPAEVKVEGRDKRKLRADDFTKEVFPCNGYDYVPRCLHGGLGPRVTASKTGKVCTCLCLKDWRGPECSFFNS